MPKRGWARKVPAAGAARVPGTSAGIGAIATRPRSARREGLADACQVLFVEFDVALDLVGQRHVPA